MKLPSIFHQAGGSANESKQSAVKCTMTEYVQRSTIHGIAYVGDDERNKFERLWWFIMLVSSVFGACSLIYQAYRTMKENPIIDSPSLTRTPVWEIPFPAVTICPTAKLEMTSFALNKTNWPEFAHDLLPDNLTELTIDGVIFYGSFVLESLLLRRSDQNNYEILRQVLPEIEINYSLFGTYPKMMEVSSQRTITQNGACVTFNMYQERDLLRDGVIPSSLDDVNNKTERLWSRDSGFNNNLPLKNYTHPFRSFAPTDAFAVSFSVNDSQRFSAFNAEYLVFSHTPDEIPICQRHCEIVSIVPGYDNYIDITPHLVISEGIEHYAPEVRQCYYSDERYLKFYKNYTQNHCERECLANYTLAKCGCIPYHLPHFSDAKLCTTDFQCFELEAAQLYLPDFKDDVGHAPVDDCNCLPSCTQLSYDPVRTKTLVDGSVGNETGIIIHIKYSHIKKDVRTELHSISEFFSNCGGSLGLFLGVSIFSILELLYFCTVRLYLHSTRRLADSNE